MSKAAVQKWQSHSSNNIMRLLERKKKRKQETINRRDYSSLLILLFPVIVPYIYWASKETYNFLEWCPLKSTASKWMIFGLMLATILLITHVKKQRNRKCQKLDKCLQITTCPFSKITETAPFPPRRLSDISIAIHSNSIAGYVIMFTIGLLYRKPIVNMITDPAIEFEWIAIEMSASLCGGKGAVSVILKLYLWFEGIYLIFGICDFFVFWRW